MTNETEPKRRTICLDTEKISDAYYDAKKKDRKLTKESFITQMAEKGIDVSSATDKKKGAS